MSNLNLLTIDTFLGVNKSDTETLLKPGEASYMSNWMITDDLKLKKMFGYEQLFNGLAKKINGMWYGLIQGIPHLVFTCGGLVYEHNLTTHENINIGTIADAFPTNFFVSNNTLYILDGNEYRQWTGTGNITTVKGYVPTVFTAAPPTGGGTILESINYLTGQKSMKFSSDGVSTVYQLPEYNIESVDSVVVNGIEQTKDTHYTVDLILGTITFVTKPILGVNNVVPTWTKTNQQDRQSITKNNYYGGIYYSRIWLFGNPDHKNTRYPSGITMSGSSDPTYFPKFSDSNVGEHEITDMCIQYNKQLIFTHGDANGASGWYSEQETTTDPYTGIVTTLFPIFPMNSRIGNAAKGQTRIIMNNPFTVYKGVYQWVSTYVLNEKNVEWVSKKIQPDLDEVDLTKAITFDWDDRGVYILAVDKRVWMYNYRVDAWYALDLPDTPTCFTIVEKDLYFGTTNGEIMKFNESLGTYNGKPIEAQWEMGFYNFGAEWLRKFIGRMFVAIKPLAQTHIDLSYETDKSNQSEVYTAKYSLSNFATWNFATFSFATNYSPQPFKFKIRAKKIDYFKLKITNNGTDSATVLSITIPSRIGGEVKNRR
ncbi:hypothetical protein [Anaerovorax sp. IOR16]|uniref:hypothetical protein n=1 Tax=Anaerovorax sp. IOR16 TaxID=2773458 RepID=UPI0019CFF5BF|nr:hypothetical protein [Anaerovorax sp. IOR16]